MDKNDEHYCDLLLKNILNHFASPGPSPDGLHSQEELGYYNADHYLDNRDNRKFIRAFNEKLKKYIAYQAELEELYPDFSEEMLKRHFHYDKLINELVYIFDFTNISGAKDFYDKIDDPDFFLEFCSSLKESLTRKSYKMLLNKYNGLKLRYGFNYIYYHNYFNKEELEYYTEIMGDKAFIEKYQVKMKKYMDGLIKNMEAPSDDSGFPRTLFEYTHEPFDDILTPMLYGYKLVEIFSAEKYLELIEDQKFMEKFHENFRPRVQNILYPKIKGFAAVLLKDNERYTSSGIKGMSKLRIVFANPLKAQDKVPYEALESNFWVLRRNYPDLFQETRFKIRETGEYLDHVWYINNYNNRGENNYSNDQIRDILNKYLTEVPHQVYYFPGLMEKEKINLNVHKIGDYNPRIVEIHLDGEIVIARDYQFSLFWILGKRSKLVTMGMIIGLL